MTAQHTGAASPRDYPPEITKALRNSTEALRLSAEGMAKAAFAAGATDERAAGRQAAWIGGQVRHAFMDAWRRERAQHRQQGHQEGGE